MQYINRIKYNVSFALNPDISNIQLETCYSPHLSNINIEVVAETRQFSNPTIGGKI